MSERITRRTEWDGTFTLLLDGAVIVERRLLADIEVYQRYLEGAMLLHPGTYFVVDKDSQEEK